MDAGKKIIEYLVEPNNLIEMNFQNIEDLMEKMTKKVNVKILVDQMRK